MDMKKQIDMELEAIYMHEDLKQKIKKKTSQKTIHKFTSRTAAALAIMILGGTTVFAGYYMHNKVVVNEEVLPELDAMHYLEINALNWQTDEYGMTRAQIEDYKNIQNELGIRLLENNMASDDSYLVGTIETNNKDFLIITLENYITGDIINYQYNEEKKFYSYEHGEEFYSPVSLTIDIMLSKEQEENGWDRDYLGFYKFKESYVSAQGYQVNLIEDTTDKEIIDDYVSEKCAVFVADGVRYMLKGRTSFENMKNIVDTMKY